MGHRLVENQHTRRVLKKENPRPKGEKSYLELQSILVLTSSYRCKVARSSSPSSCPLDWCFISEFEEASLVTYFDAKSNFSIMGCHDFTLSLNCGPRRSRDDSNTGNSLKTGILFRVRSNSAFWLCETLMQLLIFKFDINLVLYLSLVTVRERSLVVLRWRTRADTGRRPARFAGDKLSTFRPKFDTTEYFGIFSE